ncbi:MAG: glycosyltransferase [Planctomycetota bacterium]|jgi:glycosyltransferase involved in cell wall biosynthesis
MPEISVVMPVLNPDKLLFRDAVQSVLAQTHRDLELIVVEEPVGGGETSADDVLAEFADPRLRYHRNRERGTLATARNRGLQMAAADLVAMHDGDDVSEPDRLAVQVQRMRAEPDIAVLGAQLEVTDERGARLGYRAYPTGHDGIVQAMRRFNAIAHPTVMLRRDVVLAAGGYSEVVDYACEDYELWSRLAAAGKRFGNCGEALVRYRVHRGGMKSRLLRATLRDTLRVKQAYWWADMSLGDRLLAFGERLLLWLPPRLVMGLFLRLALQKRLPHPKAG